MRTSIRVLLCFFFYALRVLADIELTKPKNGETLLVGSDTELEVAWKDTSDDSDEELSLSKAKQLTILMCTGYFSDFDCFAKKYQGDYVTKKSTTISISQNDVPNGYYFLQVTVVFDDGSYTIHYSDRFRLTGMSSSPSATITDDVSYTGDIPIPQTSAKSTGDVSRSFSITYTKQTGRTRYAPMQMQPETTITVSKMSRRYATSAVTYFSTYQKKPVVYSTITPGWSYECPSHANWATAAPYPTLYYNPSEKVTKAYITSAAKKRRWLD